MNYEKFDNFDSFFKNLQNKIEILKRNREKIYSQIKEDINYFQIIESEIYKSLFDSSAYYSKKRSFFNNKIRSLKRKKKDFEKRLNNLIEKKKTLKEPELKNNISKNIELFKFKIKEIVHKIDNLNVLINNQILDINEENRIVEEIRSLESKKKIQIESLSKVENKQITLLNNNAYYKTNKEIEILEINLKEISQNLKNFSKKRYECHTKILNLYRRTSKFKIYKKKMEEELLENRKIADNYYLNFLEITNQIEKTLKNRKRYKTKNKQETEKKEPLLLDSIIKRKKLYKKLKREKLTLALEKQKVRKKLDINEFRLILEQSKKEL